MVHFNLTMYSNTNVGEKVNFVATASQHRSTSVAEESMLIRNSFVLTTFISSGGSFRVDCLVLTTFSSGGSFRVDCLVLTTFSSGGSFRVDCLENKIIGFDENFAVVSGCDFKQCVMLQ